MRGRVWPNSAVQQFGASKQAGRGEQGGRRRRTAWRARRQPLLRPAALVPLRKHKGCRLRADGGSILERSFEGGKGVWCSGSTALRRRRVRCRTHGPSKAHATFGSGFFLLASVYSQVPMSATAVPICVCAVSLLPKKSTAARRAGRGRWCVVRGGVAAGLCRDGAAAQPPKRAPQAGGRAVGRTRGGDDGHALDDVAHAVGDGRHAGQRVERKLVVQMVQQAHAAGTQRGTGGNGAGQGLGREGAWARRGQGGQPARAAVQGAPPRPAAATNYASAPEQRAVELRGALLRHLLLDGLPHTLQGTEAACRRRRRPVLAARPGTPYSCDSPCAHRCLSRP